MLKISIKKVQRTQFCEERKKRKERKGMFSNIHFFNVKISNLIKYSTDMHSSITSFKPSSEFLKKIPKKKRTTCFVA
jgi:hypothetical protein